MRQPVFIVVIGLVALVALSPLPAEAQALAAQRALVSTRYPDVRWVSTERLVRWLARPELDRPVLLDARAAREVAVSHLRGARRIDPDHPDVTALDVPRDALVVVYCSVGWRSGGVADAMRRAGYLRVYNLDGGIFAWANEGRPLHRGNMPVEVVHPYDEVWGRMLDTAHRAAVE